MVHMLDAGAPSFSPGFSSNSGSPSAMHTPVRVVTAPASQHASSGGGRGGSADRRQRRASGRGAKYSQGKGQRKAAGDTASGQASVSRTRIHNEVERVGGGGEGGGDPGGMDKVVLGGARDSLVSPPTGEMTNQGKQGKGKKKSSGGGNANHLLNFQFEPLAGQSGGGGQRGSSSVGGVGSHRRGSGKGGGGRAGGGWRGGGSGRASMSKEQFLQANFHFLLHGKPGHLIGLQESFFNPDILVDWDTIDTVLLMRIYSNTPVGIYSSNSSSRPIPFSMKQGGGSILFGCWHHSGVPTTEGNTTLEHNMPVTESSSEPERIPHTLDLQSGVAMVQLRSTRAGQRGANEEKKEEGQSVTGEELGNNGAEGGTVGAEPKGGGDGSDESWRCPICLEVPVVPKITKCGHGPFCLVCILRHLDGQDSRRCPLCFENMYR
ncbi:unnamed protein product [Choristocarpus tenellus]